MDDPPKQYKNQVIRQQEIWTGCFCNQDQECMTCRRRQQQRSVFRPLIDANDHSRRQEILCPGCLGTAFYECERCENRAEDPLLFAGYGGGKNGQRYWECEKCQHENYLAHKDPYTGKLQTGLLPVK